MKNIEMKTEYFDINGVRYEKFEDIPEKYRKVLDKNNNNVLDMFEKPLEKNENFQNQNQNIAEKQLNSIEDLSGGKRVALFVILIALGLTVYQIFF